MIWIYILWNDGSRHKIHTWIAIDAWIEWEWTSTCSKYSKSVDVEKKFTIIIPRWRFEIEGEVYIVTKYDDAKPKLVQETLTCPTKNEWIKTMEEELESMWKNQV